MANILTRLPLLTFTFCWACELCLCTIILYTKATAGTVHGLSSTEQALQAHFAQGYVSGSNKKIGLHCVWHIHHFSQVHERASWKWIVQHCHTGVVKHAWKHLFGIFAYFSPFIQHTGKQMWLHIPPHYDMQMTLYCWFLVSITFTDWEKSVKTCTAGVL